MKISAYACFVGLEACLLQENQLIAYTSRSLNSAEQNYAHIEKVVLAISFGLVKFHVQVYRKVMNIETDHKPLESKKKPKKQISNAPPRLLRFQNYG